MNQAQKKAYVADVHEAIKSSATVVVVHYKGLTVEEISSLRSKVRNAGAGFKVTKNSLTKLALKDSGYDFLEDLFTGPTAVCYSANDAVAPAKLVAEFAKDNEKLVLVGGAFGDKKLDVQGIEQLAKMPSLDELRAKIVGILSTPATRVAGVLQAPAGQLARVCGAYGASGN